MKKLLLLFSCIMLFGVMQAQKPVVLFGHVSNKSTERALLTNGQMLFSLDAVISGYEVNIKTGNGQFISGAGLAFGYKNYEDVERLVSNWGVSVGVMSTVQIGQEFSPNLKVALLPSFYNLMIGPTYTFDNTLTGLARFGVMIGGSIKF